MRRNAAFDADPIYVRDNSTNVTALNLFNNDIKHKGGKQLRDKLRNLSLRLEQAESEFKQLFNSSSSGY